MYNDKPGTSLNGDTFGEVSPQQSLKPSSGRADHVTWVLKVRTTMLSYWSTSFCELSIKAADFRGFLLFRVKHIETTVTLRWGRQTFSDGGT